MTENKPPDVQAERDFFARLARLERGPLAELRRSLGDEPGNMAQFLEREIYLSNLGNRNFKAVYLVAGLYALIERPHDDESEEEAQARAGREGKSLGHLLGQLYREQGERPSTEKRFLALLDADEAALPYQLRQAVALLRGSDVRPDWARLLSDVSRWNHDEWGDDVRRRWAREFYRGALPNTDVNDAVDDLETTPTTEETP